MEEDQNQKISYKDILKEKHLQRTHIYPLTIENTPNSHNQDCGEEDEAICLTLEDKVRLYTPWENAVIIKLFGRRCNHQYLKAKLSALWKLKENLTLIDLGDDFYTIKFDLKESQSKVLREGPWFVTGHFISVRKWEPNFVPSGYQIDSTAIWLRLPQLPTEFYDKKILERVGRKIGTLLKIDSCTSSTLREVRENLCSSPSTHPGQNKYYHRPPQTNNPVRGGGDSMQSLWKIGSYGDKLLILTKITRENK